jgi:hypothetical protein
MNTIFNQLHGYPWNTLEISYDFHGPSNVSHRMLYHPTHIRLTELHLQHTHIQRIVYCELKNLRPFYGENIKTELKKKIVHFQFEFCNKPTQLKETL